QTEAVVGIEMTTLCMFVRRCHASIRIGLHGRSSPAVRAPGLNVTLTPSTRAGSGAWNSGSMRTAPVTHSSDGKAVRHAKSTFSHLFVEAISACSYQSILR